MTIHVEIVFPGDARASDAWSGTPRGIVEGLEAVGVRVSAINADLPAGARGPLVNALAIGRLRQARERSVASTVRGARLLASMGPTVAAVRTATLKRRLRADDLPDGLIQVGTGYLVCSAVPTVTFEDMTIPQALAGPYPEWKALGVRAVAKRLALQRRAYSDAVACCLTTRWACDSVVADHGVAPEKTHAVGVGRNHDPQGGYRDWRDPRFLFVGREWERKNGPGVLRAFQQLRREVPDASLDIVGAHPPIDADGVTGHGVLRLDSAGDRHLLKGLFAQATCFVMPSLHEPSALAYVEAGAAGLPRIGTNAGGSAELIGKGGLVVDPGDHAALVDAMRRLADPGEAARMGQLAAERAALYTWPLVAERLLRALGLQLPDSREPAAFL